MRWVKWRRMREGTPSRRTEEEKPGPLWDSFEGGPPPLHQAEDSSSNPQPLEGNSQGTSPTELSWASGKGRNHKVIPSTFLAPTRPGTTVTSAGRACRLGSSHLPLFLTLSPPPGSLLYLNMVIGGKDDLIFSEVTPIHGGWETLNSHNNSEKQEQVIGHTLCAFKT